MDKYKNTVCAIGDFNIIPGKISKCMSYAISPEYIFVLKSRLTFFGSYFDTIPRDKKYENY